MDMILNSIIFFSLIATPIDKLQTNSYKMYSNKIISKKNENKNINSQDINSIMNEIDNNFNIISTLLKEKNKLSNNIAQSFNHKIKNNTKLSMKQMENFKKYNDIIVQEEKIISIHTSKIHNKQNMIKLQNEVLSIKNNFNIVYDKLLKILDSQIKVISSLYNAIFHLKLSLELIY